MKKKTSITIDDKIYDAIIREAKKENRNFSNMVEYALSEYIKSKKRKR